MIAPEVPGGRPVRHAVLRHQPHRQADDPVGVMAAGRGQVRQVGAAEEATRPAAVLGVSHGQLAWPVAAQAADLVQGAVSQAVAWARPTAARAGAAAVVPRAALRQGCRQVLNTGNAFGRVREIFARSHAQPSRAAILWKAQRSREKSQEKINFLATVSVSAWFSAVPGGFRRASWSAHRGGFAPWSSSARTLSPARS